MPNIVPGLPSSPAKAKSGSKRPAWRVRLRIRSLRGWKLYALLAVGIPFLLLSIVTVYYYVTFSRMIDARLHGEFTRTDPRVFGRPFEIRRGQAVTA